MFDYAEFSQTAEEMVREFGAPVILSRNVNAEYDVATAMVEGTERKWTGTAVRIDYSLRDIDGELIQFSDMRLLASVGGFEQPKPGDRALFDGEWLQVISCKPIKPATIAVAFDIQVRR